MAKTKAQLLEEIRSTVLQGDQYRSFARGLRDPRHRRGPQATSVTGLRYNHDEFQVDRDGRLNLRRKGIADSKLKSGGGGGTVVIPATTRRLPCEWRRYTGDGAATHDPNSAAAEATAVIGLMPASQGGGEYAIWSCPVPIDGDTTVDWTISWDVYQDIATVTGGSPSITYDVDVFAIEEGYDLDASGGIVAADATLTLTLSGLSSANNETVIGVNSVTFPTSTIITAATTELAFVLKYVSDVDISALNIGFISMWLDYQTEAATITVT